LDPKKSVIRRICQWILKIWGWKITGEIDHFPKKTLVAVSPHTSNWDFPVGILVRNALGINIRFLGKHSLFVPPLGWLMRWLGGYPIDRRKRTNTVDSVVDIFNKHEDFIIAIAPEGTRKKVDQIKTGFLFIAQKANIPIMICRFDWQIKEVRFGPLFYPTGNTEEDIATYRSFFKGVKGYYPHLGLD
jgi:1-acyl-sn-glycerol-3-phosphate acyltransferase